MLLSLSVYMSIYPQQDEKGYYLLRTLKNHTFILPQIESDGTKGYNYTASIVKFNVGLFGRVTTQLCMYQCGF